MRTIHFLLLAGLLLSFLPGLAWANSAPVVSNAATAEPSARPPGRLVVSILWFEDKTGDPQAAHWRYAIASMLSNQFRQIKAVRLRSGVRSARKRLGIAKGAGLDADQARKMGEIIEAQRVIWGSFRREGDKWQVTAKVLNVASGIATADLTMASADFFEVCDDLTDRILKELSVTPSDAERKKLERPLTSSITSLEWYSKALALQIEVKPLSEQENCARKAIATDPNFARAYLALAATLGSQGKFEPAEEAVRHVLKIRPDLADAHSILGFVLIHQKRYVESEKELREAHRLDPDDVEPLNRLGELYTIQDKFDEAIGAFNQAIVLEPMKASIHASLGVAYASKGDRDQALKELKKAEQLNSGGMEGINVEQKIGVAYDELGEIPLAVKHYDRFVMLAKKQGVDSELVRYLEERATELKARLTVAFVDDPMPMVYTGQMLQEALEKKLTREDLAMVVNPVAGNPEIKRWAIELTEGADSDLDKARAIFNGLSWRITLGESGESRGMRTAQEVFTACNDPNESFNCQESAKLYIALARDAGLKAFFTIVDEDYNGKPISHACAAVFVEGKALLVDLTYRWFGVPHKKVVVMDDMQMITSQLCEAASVELHRSLYRLALKLQPEIPITQFGLAMVLANVKEWQEARKMTEAARQVEPEHWMAYSMQGRLADNEGDLDAAESYFRKSLAKKPDDANSRYYLGYVLMAQFKLEEAREELRASLQYSLEHASAEYARRTIALLNESLGDETAQISEDPDVYLLRAARYMKEGSYDQAIAQYNKALALDADNAKAYVLRGWLYGLKADYGQAIADCTKALEIEPESVDAYFQRGCAYVQKRQCDQAILDLTKAIELNPEHADAFCNRGYAYVQKRQYDQAILDLTKTIELNPEHAEAYVLRGWLYSVKADYDRVISDCTKALEIESENTDAYYQRGSAHAKKGQYDQAILDFTKVIELNPEGTKAYDFRGAAYAAKGQYDRAISDLTKALEKNPQNAEYYIFRGTAYSHKGDYDRAIADYNKASEFDPRIPPAYYYWRGLAYLKTGDDDRAISDFNGALKANGQDTKAIVGLATAVMNKGMHKLAIGLSNRAIEIDPKFAEAYAVRARACYKNQQFEECRKNVKSAQELGYEFEPAFLDSVRNAAGNKQ